MKRNNLTSLIFCGSQNVRKHMSIVSNCFYPQIEIDTATYTVLRAYCTCKVGKTRCSHMAATLLYATKNLSKTSGDFFLQDCHHFLNGRCITLTATSKHAIV